MVDATLAGAGAMATDLAAIGVAIAAVGGTELLYVANPREAVKIKVFAPQLTFIVLASSALAAGEIACIAVPLPMVLAPIATINPQSDGCARASARCSYPGVPSCR